ncbi:MAG: HEAT repeat domain-containing protein [Gemmatimonadota bacterium]
MLAVREPRLQQAGRLLFRLEPGEGVRAGLMLVYSIAVIGGVVITGQLVSRSLFLSSLPPADIPYKYILPPAALMLATGLYARLAPHFRRDRLIVGTCAVMLAFVVGFRIVLATSGGHSFAALCALFVAFDVIGDLAAIQFWTFAGDIFNPREARRLFGLIGGGSTVANLVFGLSLSASADRVRPENLIYLMLLGLVVCAACAGALGHRHREELARADDEAGTPALPDGSWRSLAEVFRSPLVVTMGGIVVLVALASNIADYQLDLALQSAYGGDTQRMVAFLGQFRFWAGLGAGALQFFLAGRLMERFGVAPVLLLLPAAMALGSGAILVTGGALWAAAAPRACDVVLKYTVNDAALNLLYLPAGARLRARAKAVLDGMVRPPLVTILGIAFLVVGPRLSLVGWAVPVLAIVVAWALLVRRAAVQYVRALSDSIQYRRLDLERATVDLSDETSRRVVAEALRATDPMRVVHALSLLPRIPGDWADAVAALGRHPEPGVRVLALEYLSDAGDAARAAQMRAALDDPSEAVRRAAVSGLCALLGPAALAEVRPLLETAATRVRGAAVVGLIRHGGLDGVLLAGERLKAMFADPDAATRAEAARVLGDLGAPSFYHPLTELLADADPGVQLAALRATGRLRALPLLPALLPLLQAADTRAPAAEAIARCLAGDPSPLAPYLGAPDQPLAVRAVLVGLLGSLPGPAAVRLAEPLLQASEGRVRGAAAEALVALRQRGQALTLGRVDLTHAASAEADQLQELARRHLELHRDGRAPLLADALKQRAQEARDRVLALLDLVHPEVAFHWVRDSLDAPGARRRAAALELLDNVVDRSLRGRLLTLLAAGAADGPAPAAAVLERHLEELVGDGDPWVRACALFHLGTCGQRSLQPRAEAALTDGDAGVRQAAARALLALSSPAETAARLEVAAAGRTPADAYAAEVLRRARQGETRMPLSTLEKVFFLKSVPLFGHIPGEEIVELVPIIQEVDVPAGQTFIRRGDEGDCLYVLVEGEVAVELGGGRQAVMRSGEVIGELAVLTEQPRTADCTARSDLVLLRIDKGAFWELMNHQPRITIEIMRVLVDRYVRRREAE